MKIQPYIGLTLQPCTEWILPWVVCYCQAEITVRSIISAEKHHYTRRREDSAPLTSVISKLGTGKAFLLSKPGDVRPPRMSDSPRSKEGIWDKSDELLSGGASVSPLTTERNWTARTGTMLNSTWLQLCDRNSTFHKQRLCFSVRHNINI